MDKSDNEATSSGSNPPTSPTNADEEPKATSSRSRAPNTFSRRPPLPPPRYTPLTTPSSRNDISSPPPYYI